MSSTISNPAFTLRSSEYPTLHTEVTGGSLGIYELVHQDESVTVWAPRCAMNYFRNSGYSSFGLWGKESYMDIGDYYLNNDLIRPILLYELNGGHITLTNSSGTTTINCNGTTGVITCTSVNPSLEENKKNIEKFDKGLQVVKDTDIYRFNYKYEDDDIKRHIGFVIGDKYNYSKEITSQDNDGAELYSMVSVLWQAVKEQQEQIEKLNQEIEHLKERIDK